MSSKIVIGLIVVLCICYTEASKRGVMPWMCLERCHEQVQPDLEEVLRLGPSVFPLVSIEAYDLDWNASIKDCGYSRVGPKLTNAGIMVQPMITTANIQKIRELWKDPKGFVEKAMAVARSNRAWISGFNVDFEPETGDKPTHDDAVKFANFINIFGKALHAEGFKLTVDIANWCSLFEDDLLAKVEADRFITMSTYAVGIDTFKSIVKNKYDIYGTAKCGIGLYTGKGYTGEDIKARLNIVRSYGIDTVGIWETPVPSDWIPYIKAFVNDP